MRRLISMILLLVSLNAHGVGGPELNAIAKDPVWRSLLHFDAGGFFSTRSAVVDSAFFLHPDGATSPAAELRATLKGLESGSADKGQAVRCQFPARTDFLEHRLDRRFPEAQCPELDAWRRRHAGAQIGVTFVNGYLGNPASFFGHLLLHVEDQETVGDIVTQAGEPRALRLMDTSINFGADMPDDEAILPYLTKGLFGGYHARFSNTSFYRNTSIYSEKEMRDAWIYQLALKPKASRRLIDHLYEVMGHDYKYLFLSQNCASRIARTLRVVTPDLKVPGRNALWTTPEAVIRGLTASSNAEGQPLVDTIDYVPSRQAVTDNAWKALPDALQRAAAAYWPAANELADDAGLASLAPGQRARILDVMLSHELWLSSVDGGMDTGDVRTALLRQRAKLPVSDGLPSPTPPTPVHEATPAGMLRVGGASSADGEKHLRFGGRLLQYDLLDAASPRLQNAALELGAVNLELSDGDLSLRDARLLTIRSLEEQAHTLPGTQTRRPWQAMIDIQRRTINDPDSLDIRGTLHTGRSIQRGRWLAYGLMGPQLASTRNQTGALALSAELGLLTTFAGQQRTHLSLRHRNGLDGKMSRRTRLSIAHRLPLGKTHDIRWGLRYDPIDDQVESSVSIGWYLD